jgi:hypothetical protein
MRRACRGPIGAAAQTGESKALATQAAQMDSLATSQGGAKVSGKISSDFLQFSGSPANADGLVGGLRAGTPITLSSTDAKGVITSTTFTPPTGKMGYGNVYTSLAWRSSSSPGWGSPIRPRSRSRPRSSAAR